MPVVDCCSGEDVTATEEDITFGIVVVTTISMGWLIITSSNCLRRRAWFSMVAGTELSITVDPAETNQRRYSTTRGLSLPLIILIPVDCSERYWSRRERQVTVASFW